MQKKKAARLRRARKARAQIRRQGKPRLTVHRSGQHIYAQVIAPNGAEVVASASTLDKTISAELDGPGSNAAAAVRTLNVSGTLTSTDLHRPVLFARAGFRNPGRLLQQHSQNQRR